MTRRQSRSRAWALTACLVPLVAACGHAPPPEPAHVAARPSLPPWPKSPDVSKDVMGWALVRDGDRLLQDLAPSTPQPGTPTPDRKQVGAALLASAGLDPQLAMVLDLKRPAGIALLNPSLLGSADVKPYLVALPIADQATFRKWLDKQGTVAPTAYGLTVTGKLGTVHAAFVGGYAVLAWREDLLDAAWRLLQPKLRGPIDAPVALHVKLDNVYAAYGERVREVLTRLMSMGLGGDSNGFATRGLARLSRYAESVSDLEALADLGSSGLTLTLRADGPPKGEWAALVAEQHPGPAWGVQFLPVDSAMVYTTHASQRSQREELAAQLAWLAASVTAGGNDTAELERWGTALGHAVEATSGELAWSVYPSKQGGLGVGGAYRLSDPGGGRRAIIDAYVALGDRMGPALARGLGLDPAKFGSRLKVTQRDETLDGVPLHLVEVTPAWPESAKNERRVFEALFGPRLVLGTAFVGDQALFALGSDWRDRLSSMLLAARGQRVASLGDEATFSEALGFHASDRVSMTWVDTRRMAQLAAGLLQATQELSPTEREALAAMLRTLEGGAIVTTSNAHGRRYELTTHVPASAMAGAARLNGALWRVAVSPFLNPPAVPPLPLPPPHVTPPVHGPQPPSSVQREVHPPGSL